MYFNLPPPKPRPPESEEYKKEMLLERLNITRLEYALSKQAQSCLFLDAKLLLALGLTQEKLGMLNGR